MRYYSILKEDFSADASNIHKLQHLHKGRVRSSTKTVLKGLPTASESKLNNSCLSTIICKLSTKPSYIGKTVPLTGAQNVKDINLGERFFREAEHHPQQCTSTLKERMDFKDTSVDFSSGELEL